MPRSIKGTGIFPKLPDFSQHPKSLMEFKPSPELWSDGMGKQRFVLLPQGKKVDNTERTRWEFPVGTVFVKTFFDDGGPMGKARPIETRFIRRIGDLLMGAFTEYDYHVYQWNADGTDAALVIDGMTEETKVVPVDITINRMQDGKQLTINEGRPFRHDLPSLEMCKGCHEESGMEGGQSFIGFDEVRLNSKLTPDRAKTQLQELSEAGLFTKPLPPEPASIANADPRLARIMRGVFGNCVHCHMGNKVFDLRPEVFIQNTVEEADRSPERPSPARVAARGSREPRHKRPLPPVGPGEPARAGGGYGRAAAPDASVWHRGLHAHALRGRSGSARRRESLDHEPAKIGSQSVGERAPRPMQSVAAFLGLPLREHRERRAQGGVTYDAEFSSWNVFRYSDATRILTDAATFSSAGRSVQLPSIVGMDGQRHRKLRGLVTQAFTPRMVEQLAPRITAIADELLQAALGRERFDVIQDFAYPLPIRIIAEMLGIPLEDQSTFRRWSETLVAGPRTDALRGRSFAEERARTMVELEEYFSGRLELRRQTPGPDLISRLLEAEVDGERLSEVELTEFCRLLLIAGYETTACQIGNGVLLLHEMPEVAAALRADPRLLPAAVEEIVRCFPAVAASVRVATAPVEVGSQKVEKGESLTLWTTSINYDEAVFSEPETFQAARTPNRHLSFGLGPHFCLGAPLSRLEVRIALGRLLEAFPRLERADSEPVEAVDSPFLLGVKHFHLAVPTADQG